MQVLRRRLSEFPEHRLLTMPKVSPTMTSGRFIAWKKVEGEAFVEDEEIGEVESDKSTMPITARDDGFLARIFVNDDTPDLAVGTPIAITVEEEEFIDAFKNYTLPSNTSAAKSVADTKTDSSIESKSESVTPTPPPSASYTGSLGPAVTRILNQNPTINLDLIRGTGPKGRILKGDVLAAIEDGSAFATDTATKSDEVIDNREPVSITNETREEVEFVDVPVTSMRRAIAKHVVNAKQQIPHQYATVEFELDNLLSLRKRMNAKSDEASRASLNDYIIQAAAVALVHVPEMNVRYDGATGKTIQNDTVDISFAVAIPDGLVLPIVFDAERRGIAGIAETTKILVERGRKGELQPEEYEGGNFGISNLGMFGIEQFSAIVSPPQSGMLAIGAGGKLR